MTVRCSEYKDCPVKCEHKEAHEPLHLWVWVGGKGDVLESCDKIKHTCGLRLPWIEVQCVGVIDNTVKVEQKAVPV